jgi:hypothetical protein
MQEFEACDGVATTNIDTTITATRIVSLRLGLVQTLPMLPRLRIITLSEFRNQRAQIVASAEGQYLCHIAGCGIFRLKH